jgi:threonine synthase
MGLPIGPIVLATNANRTIADYFETLQWLPRESLKTLASAMDVGNPSNMERLQSMLGDAEVLREQMHISSVSDAQIEAAISADFSEYGIATCPHTAIATHTWRHLEHEFAAAHDWILVATAHPAKFETIVEPLIGRSIELPPGLAEIMLRPAHAIGIEPDLQSLVTAMVAQ